MTDPEPADALVVEGKRNAAYLDVVSATGLARLVYAIAHPMGEQRCPSCGRPYHDAILPVCECEPEVAA